jgi:hypothetical protein
MKRQAITSGAEQSSAALRRSALSGGSCYEIRRVFTADVRFEGWTTDSWLRFLRLFRPRASSYEEGTRPRGAVLCVHEQGRLRKVLHTHKGRLDPNSIEWPTPLSDIAGAFHASWVLSLERGALDEVMERFGARVERTHDLTAQFLTLLNVFGELIDEGRIDRFPKRLAGVPVPAPSVIHRVLDSICPDHRTIVFGTYRDGDLSTALVARRRGRGFDVIAGPEELRADVGLGSGDFRRDHSLLVQAVERRYGALSFGCFAEEATLERLLTDGRPGVWGKAVALRELILAPIPTAVGLALGLDGVRLATENLRVITHRLDALGLFEPALARMRKRIGAVAGDKDLARVLGFDPMAVLRALLRR